MNKNSEGKHVYSAAGLTILVHAIVALLLFFIVITTPDPPFAEPPGGGGVEVNLGNSEDGMGDVQPLEAGAQHEGASDNIQNTPTQTASVKTADNSLLTAADPDAVNINAPEKKEEKKKPEEVKKPEPQVNNAAIFRGSKNKGSKGGGEGQTGKPGDQGKPGGDPFSHNYTGDGGSGGGKGGGIGTGDGGGNGPGKGGPKVGGKLQGRVKQLAKPDKYFSEEGSVVVEISIDENGAIIYVRGGVPPSTTNNKVLVNKAEQAARNSKYSGSGEAAKGTITYYFVKG